MERGMKGGVDGDVAEGGKMNVFLGGWAIQRAIGGQKVVVE